jgi:acetylornithine deacetylase/succinyl-diaminopimelate desuccinylase-like protein
MALVTLARSGAIQDQEIELAIVSDEESGAEAGTKWLHDSGELACDYLVVGEQTENQVAVGERVACGIDLTIMGKSAHGAMPWAGDNAILKAARVICHLEQTLFPRLEARCYGHLPQATLNIGRIDGGSQWNVVAERCLVKMDRRLLPGETREAAVAEIREILETYSATVEPLSYKLYSAGEVAANIDTSPRDPFVLTANRALRDITGEKRNLTGYVQTSDGRWFARDGIPIIIFGPGDPRLAHSADEFVSAKQLVEATRFYTLLALRWAAEQVTHIGGRARDLQGADNRPSMRFV